jgi:hypothetical protein
MLFTRSQLTDAIVKHLHLLDKNTQITYSELGRIVGKSVSSRSANLQYARKILERDHNQIWVAIRPNVGIRRLNDVDIADYHKSWWLGGASRKLKRGTSSAEIVETKLLDKEQQTKFSVDCIQRELALQSLARATAKKLDKVARGSSNDMPSFNILEWAISLMPSKHP